MTPIIPDTPPHHLPPYPLHNAQSTWQHLLLSAEDTTAITQIMAGTATLVQFCQKQSLWCYREHERLARKADAELGDSFPPTKTASHLALEQLRAEAQREWGTTLVLAKFATNNGPMWAGGATTQTEAEFRQGVVALEAEEKWQTIAIRLARWQMLAGAGRVWPYLMHRYQLPPKYNSTIGLYLFLPPERGDDLLAELGEVAGREVTGWEKLLVAGGHTAVSQTLTDRWEHSRRTRHGMRQTSKTIGRPHEHPERTLAKYPTAVSCLQQGQSIRQTAQTTGISINTILKVRKILFP
jgi:hypothetical protein